MFNTLLESKPKKQRSIGAAVFSAVLHTVLITFAIYATARATGVAEKPKEEEVNYAEIKPKEPPPPDKPPEPVPQNQPVAPPPPKGFQVLTAPIDIPTVIPEIDITKSVTNE